MYLAFIVAEYADVKVAYIESAKSAYTRGVYTKGTCARGVNTIKYLRRHLLSILIIEVELFDTDYIIIKI